jgi:hypothetical protein
MRRRLLSHGCGVIVHFERENAEESPLQALFKHRNDEQIQMKTDKKIAHVIKSIFR